MAYWAASEGCGSDRPSAVGQVPERSLLYSGLCAESPTFARSAVRLTSSSSLFPTRIAVEIPTSIAVVRSGEHLVSQPSAQEVPHHGFDGSADLRYGPNTDGLQRCFLWPGNCKTHQYVRLEFGHFPGPEHGVGMAYRVLGSAEFLAALHIH